MCCRDTENPEDLVYQLSATWKHYVTWRQRNAERNWYVTTYQTIPGPAAFSDFPEPREGCQSPSSDRCQPCPSTDHGHTQTPMRNEPAVGFTGTRGIWQPCKPPALQSQGRDTCPEAVTHSPHWLTVKPAKWTQTSILSPPHFHDMAQALSWPLSHSDIPVLRSIA